MKKLITILALFLITIMTASAVDLSDYPDFLISNGNFNGILVVGANAPGEDVVSVIDIATAFPVPIGASRLDSEINDITDYNAIVVGSPCVNSAAAELEEARGSHCDDRLEEGKGYIKLFKHGKRIQILVTGIESTDRRAAARVLARYKEFDLEGDAMEVDGWMSAPQKYSTPAKIELQKQEAAEKQKHDAELRRQVMEINAALAQNREKKNAEPAIISPSAQTPAPAERSIFESILDALFRWF